MELDLANLSDETFFSHANWAQEQGLWDGRQVTVENFSEFSEAIKAKIEFLIRTEAFPDPELYQLTANFALLGADPEDHAEIFADIKEEGLLPDGSVILKVGVGKKLSKFWKKHKVKILVGVAVAAVITAVAIVVLTSGGTASGAAIAAGGAAIDGIKDSNNKGNVPNGSSPATVKREESPFIAPTPETIGYPSELFSQTPDNTFKDPFPLEPYRPTLPNYQPHFPQEYYPKPEKKDIFSIEGNKFPEFYPDNRFQYPQFPHDLKGFEDNPISKIPSQNPTPLMNDFSMAPGRDIPVLTSSTDHPTKSWTQWTMENLSWNPDVETPTPPDTSMIFRTEGKIDPSMRIFGINGMGTSLEEAIGHAEHIAKYSNGLAVDWVYNRSHGTAVDLIEAGLLNMNGISPVTAELVQENLLEFHQQNIDNPNAKCLHFCQSQGSIILKNGLAGLPKEVRDRAIVVALAPAAPIPQEFCFRAYNYRIKGDPVPYSEMSVRGFFDSNEVISSERVQEAVNNHYETIVLEPHPDSEPIWHGLQDPTFIEIVRERMDDYYIRRGEY